MILRCATGIAVAAIMSLVPTVEAAEAPAIPDFSKGMPGATVEKKEQDKGIEAFHLKTELSSREFFKRLRTTLGAGWRKRTLNKEEMSLSASKARSKNAEVNLSVFEHGELPGVNIRVMHFKHKEEDVGATAEIAVIRPKRTKAEQTLPADGEDSAAKE